MKSDLATITLRDHYKELAEIKEQLLKEIENAGWTGETADEIIAEIIEKVFKQAGVEELKCQNK